MAAMQAFKTLLLQITAESFEISSHWSPQNYIWDFWNFEFPIFREICDYIWPIFSECDYMIWPQWPWKVNVKLTQILKASIS